MSDRNPDSVARLREQLHRQDQTIAMLRQRLALYSVALERIAELSHRSLIETIPPEPP